MSTVEDIWLGGKLTEEQAGRVWSRGEEAGALVLLEVAKRLADQKAASAAESPAEDSTVSSHCSYDISGHKCDSSVKCVNSARQVC